MKLLLRLLLMGAALCGFFTEPVSAQLNPMPLGTVSNVQSAICPTGFASGASCSTATVSCPELPDIAITFGTKGTAKNVAQIGTVIFVNGDGGNMPYGSGFTLSYAKAGLSSVQFAFATAWELGAANVLEAACRPATMLSYFYQPTVPYAVQSTSAGSGAVAYAFAWYGLSGEFKNWEAIVGPVFSNIAAGCELPVSASISVVPTNGIPFADPVQYTSEASFMSSATGQKCLPKSGSTSGAAIAAWEAQSIVQAGATLAFPSTSIASWVCNNGLNPSAAQAYLFLAQVATPWSLTAITNCVGPEGVGPGLTPQGLTGTAAITADMLAVMEL